MMFRVVSRCAMLVNAWLLVSHLLLVGASENCAEEGSCPASRSLLQSQMHEVRGGKGNARKVGKGKRKSKRKGSKGDSGDSDESLYPVTTTEEAMTTTSTTTFEAISYSFVFGGKSVASVPGAIVDKGDRYGTHTTDSGITYGWLCDGKVMDRWQEESQRGGVRSPPRARYGLNHFDRFNKCRQWGTYLEVAWKLNVPPGNYSVNVIFPERYNHDCEVQGELACTGQGTTCTYSKTVQIQGEGFQVVGYGHDSGKCHSLGKVTIDRVG